MNKQLKKKAGKCPVCGLGLYKDESALLEKIGLAADDIEGQSLTEKDVKDAFKKQVKELHPDRGGDPEEFQEAKEARDELLERLSDGDLELEKEEETPPPTNQQILQALGAVKRLRKIRSGNPDQKCPYCRQKPKASQN